MSAVQVFLKTPWKMEKLLARCNFFFSHSVSNLLEKFCHFHQIQNCHLQTLSRLNSLKFVLWERVKHILGKGACSKWLCHVLTKGGLMQLIVAAFNLLYNKRLNFVVECSRDMQTILKLENSFDSSQPAHTARVDMGRYFSQLLQAPF